MSMAENFDGIWIWVEYISFNGTLIIIYMAYASICLSLRAFLKIY